MSQPLDERSLFDEIAVYAVLVVLLGGELIYAGLFLLAGVIATMVLWLYGDRRGRAKTAV